MNSTGRALAAIGFLCVVGTGNSGAATLQTLYSFCSGKHDCADGAQPVGGLAMDSSGNLYGQAVLEPGGRALVYELEANEARNAWTYKILYDGFCKDADCADGSYGDFGLIIGEDRTLYGVSSYSGGIVFSLSPVAEPKRWKHRVLYDLCAEKTCNDAYIPGSALSYAGQSSGLAYDGVSPLFGVTESGGGASSGIAYMLMPRKHGKWARRVLHDFCLTDCADGANPSGELLIGDGNRLFGVALSGGNQNGGVIYTLKPNHKLTKWTHKTLFKFDGSFGSPTGHEPNGGLIADDRGNLFGTTLSGGGLYKFHLANTQETVLHAFCSEPNCADGWFPDHSRLVMDAAGNLFGTTLQGGPNLYDFRTAGIVYKYDGTTYSNFYDFCGTANCADGAFPSNVVIDARGRLFGTTAAGGAKGHGTVFMISP